MGKRRHSMRLALVAVAILVIATLGAHWSRVEEAWQGMLARGERLRARIDASTATRPVLWGDAEPGDAWVDYDRAIAATDRIDAHDRWIDHRRENTSGDPAKALELRESLLADAAEALAALRSGAGRADARRAIDWTSGSKARTPNLLAARGLLNTAVLEAERRAKTGDSVGSARVLLDGMQLGGDLLHSPLVIDQMIGAALIVIASKEALLDRGLVDELSRPGLEQLRTGMQLLDDRLRGQGNFFCGELLLFVHHVRDNGGAELLDPSSGFLSRWDTWRFLFSLELTCAEYVREMEGHIGELQAAADLAWPARVVELERMQAALASSANPITERATYNLTAAVRTHVQTVALLRLARAAVAFRLDGEVPVLADPFGSNLQHSTTDTTVRIWSAGDAKIHVVRLAVELELTPAETHSTPR